MSCGVLSLISEIGSNSLIIFYSYTQLLCLLGIVGCESNVGIDFMVITIFCVFKPRNFLIFRVYHKELAINQHVIQSDIYGVN